MRKSEIIWLIIKLIGLYLAYDAAASAITLFSTFTTVLQSPELFSKSFSLIMPQIAWFIAKVIAAIYLLRDGSLIFNLLNQEEPPNRMQNDFDENSVK